MRSALQSNIMLELYCDEENKANIIEIIGNALSKLLVNNSYFFDTINLKSNCQFIVL